MSTENPLETTDTPTEAPAVELSADEQALAAMDQGFTEAAPVEDEATAEADAEAAPVEPAATETPPPGTTAAAAKDAAAPAKDEAIDKEAADLGLKGKANERFREMAAEIKTLAPVKEAMEKAGIKDLAELPQLVEHAAFGRELYKQVTDTGANAEQYGQALDYLAYINKAMAGDLKAAEYCFTTMQGELASVAKLLGREVPGIHDPLADHPDLKQQVAEGDTSRELALETARLRNAQALSEAGRQAAASKQEQTKQQEQVLTQATADLNTLGAELAAIDPHFAAKAPVLVAQLQVLKDALPPSQWVAKARALYAAIPAPAPAAVVPTPAAAARVQPGPMRGASLRAPVLPQTDDPMEAMEQAFR